MGVGVVIISASQHGNDNFNAATDIADTFSIVKANQLISITSLPDVTIDSSIVRLNASVNSGLPLIYSITTDPVIGVAELSGSIINLLRHKGTIIVYVSQAGNQFYNSTIIQRVFNVLGRSQSIAFLPILNKSFGDASFTLNATASSQLPVSFTLVNGVGFISGNQLTIASAGTITVEANQAGDDTINPAPPVRQTFLANKATQTIAVDSIPDKTFGDSILV
ncbi:MAG: hypothetical protein IPI77_18360 [Saprospiraceae bacterium]|nr:hypothetical protein [Saprospiraceae bacterium]